MADEVPAPQSSPYRVPPSLIGKGSGVLLILILLVAVGFPLLARAVRYAACARSADNLRQIGEATHKCNDTYTEMPLVSGEWAGIPTSNSTQRTIFFCLLPFVGQDQLYKNLLRSGPNAPLGYRVPTYLSRDDSSGRGLLGECSYAANWQVFQSQTESVVTTNPLTGATPEYAAIPRNFPDGLVNIVMFAEIYQNCNGTVRMWGQTGTATDFRVPAFNREAKNSWELNASLEFPQLGPKVGDCLPALAQTSDSGGILIGLADGSVRKLTSTMSLTSWRRACCPADASTTSMYNSCWCPWP